MQGGIDPFQFFVQVPSLEASFAKLVNLFCRPNLPQEQKIRQRQGFPLPSEKGFVRMTYLFEVLAKVPMSIQKFSFQLGILHKGPQFPEGRGGGGMDEGQKQIFRVFGGGEGKGGEEGQGLESFGEGDGVFPDHVKKLGKEGGGRELEGFPEKVRWGQALEVESFQPGAEVRVEGEAVLAPKPDEPEKADRVAKERGAAGAEDVCGQVLQAVEWIHQAFRVHVDADGVDGEVPPSPGFLRGQLGIDVGLELLVLEPGFFLWESFPAGGGQFNVDVLKRKAQDVKGENFHFLGKATFGQSGDFRECVGVADLEVQVEGVRLAVAEPVADAATDQDGVHTAVLEGFDESEDGRGKAGDEIFYVLSGGHTSEVIPENC